jgi:hypothetical protein
MRMRELQMERLTDKEEWGGDLRRGCNIMIVLSLSHAPLVLLGAERPSTCSILPNFTLSPLPPSQRASHRELESERLQVKSVGGV